MQPDLSDSTLENNEDEWSIEAHQAEVAAVKKAKKKTASSKNKKLETK